jgi:hypothetical protein
MDAICWKSRHLFGSFIAQNTMQPKVRIELLFEYEEMRSAMA